MVRVLSGIHAEVVRLVELGRLGKRFGVTDREIMEAIWVAAEMRAGAAFAHSHLALAELK